MVPAKVLEGASLFLFLPLPAASAPAPRASSRARDDTRDTTGRIGFTSQRVRAKGCLREDQRSRGRFVRRLYLPRRAFLRRRSRARRISLREASGARSSSSASLR